MSGLVFPVMVTKTVPAKFKSRKMGGTRKNTSSEALLRNAQRQTTILKTRMDDRTSIRAGLTRVVNTPSLRFRMVINRRRVVKNADIHLNA